MLPYFSESMRLLYLFLIYSFFGWVIEAVYVSFRKRAFVNRGYLNGPMCIIYGFGAVVMTVFLHDLKSTWFFLFLGAALFGTAVEWVGGHILEKMGIGRWWDYSKLRYNLGGYISLRYSLLWGLLGLVVVKWINHLLLIPYTFVPEIGRNILLFTLLAITVLDFLGSHAAVHHLKSRKYIREANEQLDQLTEDLQGRIARMVEKRIAAAHDLSARTARKEKPKPTVFAEGCGFYKLFMLLVLGAVLGDIVETVFCFATAGVWMSRSSLVWGQFSLVWGLARALASKTLYRYSEKSDRVLFGAGFLLGGAYEYACSVFTELAFGTVFWDYSAYPFNLGGRINLLYCFFWGFAAVVWMRFFYPRLSRLIEKLPITFGKVLTWGLFLFMAVDCAVTGLAMLRYEMRKTGEASPHPDSEIIAYIDDSFDNEWMEQRYQNMVFVVPTPTPAAAEQQQ